MPALDLAERLEDFKKSSSDHSFWPDSFSISEWLHQSQRIIASGQLTDGYLLKLAASHNGALATFDLRIEPSLVGENDQKILEYIPTDS